MTDRTDVGLSPTSTPPTCVAHHRCRDGWLGTPDAPVPCPVHRPHLKHRFGRWYLDRDQLPRRRTL